MIRSSKGFTMVEMVVVIAILVIIGLFSYSAVTSMQFSKLIEAGHYVVNDIKFARNNAITSADWTGVQFSTITNGYTVYTTDGVNDITMASPFDGTSPFTVSLSSLYPGVAITFYDISAGSKVEFDPLGVPYNDKTGTALLSSGTVRMTYGAYTINIKIDPRTGKVYIQ